MRILTALLFAAMMSQAALASDLCSMSRDAANSSETCVNWYFACTLGDLQLGPAVPPFDDIPYSRRQELAIELTFLEAEQNCSAFDYTTAMAAMNAKKTLISK